MNPTTRTVLRVLGGTAVLAGGILHLKIWGSDYREIPSGALPGVWVVKSGFPVQAALSAVVAALVVFLARPITWLAGVALELGSVIALVLSRQASLFGWQEPDWSTNAKQVLVVELAGAVLLATLLLLDLRSASASGNEREKASY